MKTKILLVDDEKDFADALSARLELRGYEVMVAYSGGDSFEVIEKNSFDVVVLDVHMPGISGTETLQRLKELAPLVPVVMLTGDATVEKAIAAMKIGAYDFLMKPIDTDTLVEKIKGAVTLKKQHEKRIHKAEVDNILSRRGW